jgi:hypothetical protein
MKPQITTLSAIVCLFLVLPSLAQDSRTWTGKWGNRKYGTSGPLKCVAKESKPGVWNAVFSGKFKGSPFSFKVAFQGKPNRQGAQLSGTSTVQGGRYQWSGAIRDRQLSGSYKASNGNYGEFTLNEVGAAPKPKTPGTTSPSTPAATREETKYEISSGDEILFVGNSYMANEGGVYNYLTAALEKKRVKLRTRKLIYFGRPLKEMMKPEVRRQIESGASAAVVFTSGEVDIMKQFAGGIKQAGKKPVIFMSWEARHPGNRATATQYTEATKQAVQRMRQMERETSAIIVPTAVVFHDLTIRPPEGMPRVDYLWKPSNIHQNEIGTMVNAWMFYAVLTGNSPVGMNFDMAPYVVGQKLKTNPKLPFTRDLRTALQERVWKVAQAWKSGKSHLE